MPRGDEGGKLRSLPSGRHGLSPQFVAQNQRERLTAGAIAAVVSHGFRNAGVTQIAEAAGVSRRTFYEYFASKEECLLATYDEVEEQLLRIVAEAGDGVRGWSGKVRGRTIALAEVLAANPNLARFALIAPPAAGGEFLGKLRTLLRNLIVAVTDGVPEGRGYATPAEEELEAAAGGVAAVLAAGIEDGSGSLPTVAAPRIVEIVLVPIIGRPRASSEAEKTRSDAANHAPRSR